MIKKTIISTLLIISTLVYSQKNYLIGDSQTSYIKKQSKKVQLYKPLYKIGIGLKGLNQKFNGVEKDYCVEKVFICIGVNDGYQDSGVNTLIKNIRSKFPNARVYVIQGSWGWGSVSRLNGNSRKYLDYYNIFRNIGVQVLNSKIGPGDPHRDKSEYQKIGKEIDLIIR